ncbi:hypothetical protein Tco_0367387 [Tanacetum coccineum]
MRNTVVRIGARAFIYTGDSLREPGRHRMMRWVLPPSMWGMYSRDYGGVDRRTRRNRLCLESARAFQYGSNKRAFDKTPFEYGEAAFILGIKIYRDRSKRLIGLGQNAYMDKILKRYKMDNSKRGHIPMQERLDLNKTQGASTPKEVKRMQNVPYASAVGSIMYVVRCTRPDVAFAQNITSRFQQNPGESHWTAVKNILKYLRNTKDMFLVYGGNLEAELRVDCYCNAGFETDIDDMKSLTGYVSF